jgi:hypothetical protein
MPSSCNENVLVIQHVYAWHWSSIGTLALVYEQHSGPAKKFAHILKQVKLQFVHVPYSKDTLRWYSLHTGKRHVGDTSCICWLMIFCQLSSEKRTYDCHIGNLAAEKYQHNLFCSTGSHPRKNSVHGHILTHESSHDAEPLFTFFKDKLYLLFACRLQEVHGPSHQRFNSYSAPKSSSIKTSLSEN